VRTETATRRATVLALFSLSLLAPLACAPPVTPCSGSACASDGASPDAAGPDAPTPDSAQDGPDAGAPGTLAASVDRLCRRAVACGTQPELERCVTDVTRRVEPYESCAGFPAAYAALVACGEAAPCDDASTCDPRQQEVNASLLDCVTPAPVEAAIARVCARSGACAQLDPGCEGQYAERLIPAGPSCSGAHSALDAVATCLEAQACDALSNCDPQWSALDDAVFLCSAGPPPQGEPFAEPRAYLHQIVPADQCSPEQGPCSQTADFCPNGRASYVVTDVVLPGLYAVSAGTLTLSLGETGGETNDLLTFSVEGSGDRLVRSEDGAVFVRQPFDPVCP
jgi:hypothetical protein